MGSQDEGFTRQLGRLTDEQMAYTWVGAETISTTAGTSVNYTLTLPSSLGHIQRADLQAGSSGAEDFVFYTFDATAPTSINGKVFGNHHGTALAAMAQLTLFNNELPNLTLAGSTAGITINVNYYS